MQFFTIGVYHSTEDEFFNKLTENHIDFFCDIRQRRAVRGSKYAFANSGRLQKTLEKLGITYEHITGLAPTTEIRALQKQADQQKGERNTEREELDKSFATAYKKNILDNFDMEDFISHLSDLGAKKIVLFCVEEHAEACHRSIVTEKLKSKYHLKVTHL
jgi:uncharacterized protein (DUF488 family)